MQDTSVVAIGNIYLDTNIWGVESGEKELLAAGQDYVAKNGETVLGGSAVNFLLALRKLNVNVAFCGRVGEDEDGKEVVGLLNDNGINSDLVVSSSETTSRAVNMSFDHNGEFVGVHYGVASKNISLKDIDFENEIFKHAKFVYFGGTIKQPEIFNSLPTILPKIRETGAKIVLDPNRFVLEAKEEQREVLLKSLQHVDIYCPNETEIQQVAQIESMDEALSKLIATGVGIIVVKLGSKGARIKTEDQDISVEGFKVNAISTVGAGDVFNAGFLTEYMQGKSLEECAKFASAVAAIKVSTGERPTREEVEKFIS